MFNFDVKYQKFSQQFWRWVQVWIFLMSDDLEVVTFDLNVASSSHMLHGGKNLHTTQWFAS